MLKRIGVNHNYPPYLLVMCLAFLCWGEKVQAQLAPDYKPKLLRFDEEYSKLDDAVKNKKWWLHSKNIAINKSGSIKASVGFDYREMFEFIKGNDSAGVSDGYWVTRLMAHADISAGKHWRGFVQLARGIITERQLPIRSVDEDQLFLLNAFAEYKFGKTNASYIRAGRQELFFGMGRLIAPREGPNIRNSYDGFRMHKMMGPVSLDGFFSYLVDNKPGIFDNKVLGNNQRLWGLYSNRKGKKINIDLYYLGYYNPAALYSKQANRNKETRHSIGVRAYRKYASGFDYDAEATYQFGTFGDNSISAFMVDGKAGREFKKGKSVFKPSVKITCTFGNRSLTNDRLNTFNPLFPNLLYYQTAVGIFPANIINPQASVNWAYKTVSINTGADLFWRASKKDGLYAPFGNVLLNNSSEKYLGYQLYLKADYSPTQNLGFTFLVSRFYKSNFIKQNPDRRGIDLLVNLLLNYKL